MTPITKHQIIHKFTEGLTKDLSDSFVLVGSAGIGKTHTVLSSLKSLRLQENQHFKYLNNYSSPLEFYHLLQRINELQKNRVLILDDCEEFLGNQKITGMLRSALWAGTNGKRIINWNSPKAETTSFEFTGKIIFLINSLNLKNGLIRALVSRGFYYHLQLSNEEKIALMREQSKKPYKNLNPKDRQKVMDYLAQQGRSSQKLTLRSLPLAYNLYILSPNHHRNLIDELLKP